MLNFTSFFYFLSILSFTGGNPEVPKNSTSFTAELWKITVLPLYHHILETSKLRSVDSMETMLEGAAIK